MLKPAAFMPANAASNASIAMGFLMAPLMLQRGPMGARFKAPPLNDTVPAELAGLSPRVQRALGFVPLAADQPSACGGCARMRTQPLTSRALLPQAAHSTACPRWRSVTASPPADEPRLTMPRGSHAAPDVQTRSSLLIAAPPRCWSPCPPAQPPARGRRAGAPPPKAPPQPRRRLCPPPPTPPPSAACARARVSPPQESHRAHGMQRTAPQRPAPPPSRAPPR